MKFLNMSKQTEQQLADALLRIGNLIKNARLIKKMTQIDFCEKSGMMQSQLSAIEAGRANVTFETLLRIANVLHLKLDITFTP
jgi:transcriptional regulator with XRE-family HTH domain